MTVNFLVPQKYFQIFSIALVITAISYILIEKKIIKEPEQNLYLIFTCLTSIAWLKLFSSIILDIIIYISLYFRINETFLSVVIVSIGNSLGDLFSVSALSKMGDEKLAF